MKEGRGSMGTKVHAVQSTSTLGKIVSPPGTQDPGQTIRRSAHGSGTSLNSNSSGMAMTLLGVS
jgi:hypothetical protein